MDRLLLTLPSSVTKLVLEELDNRQLLALRSKFPDLVLSILLKYVTLCPYDDSCPTLDSSNIIYSCKNITVALKKYDYEARYLVGSNVTDSEVDASSQILSHIQYFKVDYLGTPMKISIDKLIKIMSHLRADKLRFCIRTAEEAVYKLNAENTILSYHHRESKPKFHFGDRLRELSINSRHINLLESSTFANLDLLKSLDLGMGASELDINTIVSFYNLRRLQISFRSLVNGHNLAKLKSLEKLEISTNLQEMVRIPKSIRELKFRNQEFDVPIKLENYPNLVSLELLFSRIPELELTNVPNLQTLDIPPKTILNCDLLTIKTLSATSQVLDSGLIDLLNLETFNLYKRNAEYLDFSSCPRLKTLNVCFDLSTYPNEIGPLRMVKSHTLETLHIERHIKDMLVIECPSLTNLKIQNFDTSVACDVSIEKCVALKVLKVRFLHSKFDSQFLSSMKHLKSIESISIAGNTVIPSTKCFKNLTKLVHLKLINVGLEQLESLETLTSLQKLVFENSKVRVLGSLPKSLSHLHCIDNKLTELDIGDLPNLEYLNCSGGHISRIRRLENLPNLRVLWLAGNRISDVEMIRDLPALMSLSLHRTKLETLDPVNGFTNLPNLNMLDVSMSRIRYVGKLEMLAKCSQLAQIRLDGNVLQTINMDFSKFSPFTEFWLKPKVAKRFEELSCVEETSVPVKLGMAYKVKRPEQPKQ